MLKHASTLNSTHVPRQSGRLAGSLTALAAVHGSWMLKH